MDSQETYTQVWPQFPFLAYTYGLPFYLACAKHLSQTLNVSRPYIMASETLSRTTDNLRKLEEALQGVAITIAGVRRGMKPHTLYSEVLETVDEVRTTEADCIITLGGGSLIDGAKAVAFAIPNDLRTPDDMDTIFDESMAVFKKHGHSPDPALMGKLKPSTMPIVCATTTLSGGEFNAMGSPTNDVTHRKHLFHPGTQIGPKIIILDPQLTLTTPMRTWIGTGVRALDHCVEAYLSRSATPESTTYARKGLRLLVPALLRCKHNPEALEPRLECQLAGVESMRMIFLKVPVGGSHGIGHQLGPMGVAHGETSCVLLPAVMKYNSRVNRETQKEILDLLWEQGPVAELLKARGLEKGKVDLGGCVRCGD